MTLSWVPCEACQWSVQMKLLLNKNTKQQSNLHKERLKGTLTGCLGNSVYGTEPNSTQQVWYVGIQVNFMTTM